MPLIRWEPTRELSSLQNEMNRLFNAFFDTPVADAGAPVRRWIPATDLVETEGEYVLRADLPGMTENDVNIEFEDGVLTISGERKAEHEENKEGYYRVERAFGSFSRSLTLPDGVNPDAIKASFDKGVLEVRIPKPEERKPRKVAITLGEGARTIESSAKPANGSDPVGAGSTAAA
jgi:HSP20 family protein